MTASLALWRLPMHFPTRLIQLCKAADLAQQHLADTATLHVNQICRYEAGSAQPTLEALIRLAKALHISPDALVFEDGDQGSDDDLRLQFEWMKQLPSEDKQAIPAMLGGMIVKHLTKQRVDLHT